MEIVRLLGVNFAVSLALFILLWLVNLRTKDPSFIDGWWPLGMVVTAWVSFAAVGHGGERGLLLTLLCTAWGLRLGLYLLWRWRKHGPDRRYVTMMAKANSERGWSYARASLLLVFALQLPLQFVVSLPVQLGQIARAPVGPLAVAGAALAVIGIGFESLGDYQLTAFKADPANAGRLMRTGLWHYTRHPNYFGDACAWWGLWLIAAQTPLGAATIVGPILITFLLTRFSGVPTVEGRLRRTRPDYEAYARRTSGFFPWPPRKAN